MVIRKPERKGLEISPRAGPAWTARPFGAEPSSNGNGHLKKDTQGLFRSFGLLPTPAGNEEIREPYLESWVVNTCIRTRADGVEQAPFKIRAGIAPDSEVLGPDHPVVKLFSKPNPWTSWSQHAAMGLIHRDLSGEDFWFLADKEGKPIVSGRDAENPMVLIDLPKAIHSINGSYVGDERGKDGHVGIWKYGTGQGGEVRYPAGSVLHFFNYDPTDPCRGLGPVEVARRQLSIAFQAERYGEATLRSGGPGAFIVYEQEMLAEMQEDFQEKIDVAMQDPRSAGKLKVLTGKPTVVPIPSNPKDMLSIDQLEWSRDVVASLLGVPLPIIGVLEHTTYSNMKEAWRQFWLRLRAYLSTVEDVINTSFFPRLKDPALRQLRFGFDYANIAALREDDAALITAAGELVAKGVGITFNEALTTFGCSAPRPPNGDVSLYLAQMQTAPNPPRAAGSPGQLLQVLHEEIRNGIAAQES